MRFFILHSILAALFQACGAPVNSMSPFPDGPKLKDKISKAFELLAKERGELSTENLPFLSELSTGDASRCQDFKDLASVQSLPVKSAKWNGQNSKLKNEKGQRLLRAEIWSCVFLNTAVIELAQNVFERMKANVDNVGADDSSNPDQVFKTTPVEKSVFDASTLTFRSKLNLTSKREDNGLIDLNNSLAIVGKVFDQESVKGNSQNDAEKIPPFVAVSVHSTEEGSLNPQ